jgi:DNA-binding NarL/FixJ family response regulator
MQSPLDNLRVLIVASSPLARAGLAALLNDQNGLRIVGQIAGDADLADSRDLYRPDALVWDMGWDPLQGLDRIGDARAPIVALLADVAHAADAAAPLLGAGARGLLLQSAGAQALSAALHAVAQGMVIIHEEIAAALFADSVRLSAPLSNGSIAPADALTPRELEVIHLIAEGLPNKTIAGKLSISEHTVKFHVNAILTKLGAQSRTEAVVRATRLGLISL